MAVHEILAALADENQKNILQKLKERKISSDDLANSINMTPQALSYHLSKKNMGKTIKMLLSL